MLFYTTSLLSLLLFLSNCSFSSHTTPFPFTLLLFLSHSSSSSNPAPFFQCFSSSYTTSNHLTMFILHFYYSCYGNNAHNCLLNFNISHDTAAPFTLFLPSYTVTPPFCYTNPSYTTPPFLLLPLV